ncbi:MAG: amino acid kinase [Candidatus Thiodiazotropha sp.]
MWVVKLGGSLFNSANLRDWLAVLANAGSLVIVPGGGPFADQVRLAQHHWQFDDSAAHLMALLAMEQFGRMLCGLQTGLAAAANQSQIDEALWRGETPVWMPTAMVMADPKIRHSWEVTSDSLAAWLCGKLDIEKLLLVKSVLLDSKSPPVDKLMEAGIVDAQFRAFLERNTIQAWVLAGGDHASFVKLRQGNRDVAAKIDTGEGY